MGLIKKADVKNHFAARRARQLSLLTRTPNSLGAESSAPPTKASPRNSGLEAVRAVPRPISVPRSSTQKPAGSGEVSTTVKSSKP
jgi:hypothetical protein